MPAVISVWLSLSPYISLCLYLFISLSLALALSLAHVFSRLFSFFPLAICLTLSFRGMEVNLPTDRHPGTNTKRSQIASALSL